MKVTMLPMLSSATHPVKPVLNRIADNSLRLSAPPDSDNHDAFWVVKMDGGQDYGQ